MNSTTYVVADTITMTRRTLSHMLRNPAPTLIATLGTPILLLVLMYNLFDGVIQQAGTVAGQGSYINYLTPGLILIAALYGLGMATLRANTDMTQGIIARFRTMSIARISVLNGHVLGSTIGTLVGIAVLTVLAWLTGFRPNSEPLALIAALGLIILCVWSMTWLGIAVGVSSKSPDAANSTLFLLYILPFLSSAFVPTSSMTSVVAWIAENQPFSPIIDTLRGLLMGTPIGTRWIVAIAWCLVFTLIGSLVARAAYNRQTNT
ncbi:MAG: ABC transporter permease [Anaerolineae bacterium]